MSAHGSQRGAGVGYLCSSERPNPHIGIYIRRCSLLHARVLLPDLRRTGAPGHRTQLGLLVQPDSVQSLDSFHPSIHGAMMN
jgi:hypothetical protein